MKKIFALILALAMTLSLTAALADVEGTDYTFEAEYTELEGLEGLGHLESLICVSLPFPWLGLPPPSFLVADFRQRGVDVSQVAWQSRGETPCSCCIVNISNGSRTIVLYDT